MTQYFLLSTKLGLEVTETENKNFLKQYYSKKEFDSLKEITEQDANAIWDMQTEKVGEAIRFGYNN